MCNYYQQYNTMIILNISGLVGLHSVTYTLSFPFTEMGYWYSYYSKLEPNWVVEMK